MNNWCFLHLEHAFECMCVSDHRRPCVVTCCLVVTRDALCHSSSLFAADCDQWFKRRMYSILCFITAGFRGCTFQRGSKATVHKRLQVPPTIILKKTTSTHAYVCYMQLDMCLIYEWYGLTTLSKHCVLVYMRNNVTPGEIIWKNLVLPWGWRICWYEAKGATALYDLSTIFKAKGISWV